MKQTTKRFLSMIIGLALLVGAMMLYFQFIRPAFDSIMEIKAKHLSQQQFLLNKQSTIKKVQELISSYQTQGQIQQAVSLVLPDKEDISGGLAQLYGIAKASGLALESVSISVGEARSELNGAAAGKTQTPSFVLQKPVGTVTYRAKLSGSYVSLKNFLELLETNIRIFDLEALSFTPTGQAGSGTLFTYDLAVKTYYQRPD